MGNEVLTLNKNACCAVFIFMLLAVGTLDFLVCVGSLKFTNNDVGGFAVFLLMVLNAIAIVGIYYFGAALTKNDRTLIIVN